MATAQADSVAALEELRAVRDRAGRLRDIDVRTLQKVGRYVRGELTPPRQHGCIQLQHRADPIRQADVLQHRQILEQTELLKNKAHLDRPKILAVFGG